MTDLQNIIACPRCKEQLKYSEHQCACTSCSQVYPVREGIPCFIQGNTEASERSVFWDRGWGKRVISENGDAHYLYDLSPKDFRDRIREAITALKNERAMLTFEANPEIVRNAIVLNIGPGSGMEGPILTEYGARYIGVDFSFNAVKLTSSYLRTLERPEFAVAQADAENLPIMTSSIDIVYSFGVLHHTPNTQRTLDEVYRVLKPGGTAFIGLYATCSTQFIMERIIGTIKGFSIGKNRRKWYTFGEFDWATEGCRNPWTKTYSKRELRAMLAKYGYRSITLRKGMSALEGIPVLSAYIRNIYIFRKVGQLLDPVLGAMIMMTLEK